MEEIIEQFIKSFQKRQDGVWDSLLVSYNYKIYWAGTIIRIDLKPIEG